MQAGLLDETKRGTSRQVPHWHIHTLSALRVGTSSFSGSLLASCISTIDIRSNGWAWLRRTSSSWTCWHSERILVWVLPHRTDQEEAPPSQASMGSRSINRIIHVVGRYRKIATQVGTVSRAEKMFMLWEGESRKVRWHFSVSNPCHRALARPNNGNAYDRQTSFFWRMTKIEEQQTNIRALCHHVVFFYLDYL